MSPRLSFRQREILSLLCAGGRIVWDPEDRRYQIVREVRGPVLPTLRALERLGLAFSLDENTDGERWYAAFEGRAALAEQAEP